MYAEAFEQRNALDKLEAFASLNGLRFYGLPVNTDRITLVREEWTAPASLPFGELTVIPLRAGEKLALAPAGGTRVSEDHFDDELEGNGGGGGSRHPMAARFRGYLPVVVDVETGGFNSATDALLEIAATTIAMDEKGFAYPGSHLLLPGRAFEGANIEAAALEFTGIKLDHPLRMAVSEEACAERYLPRRAQGPQGQRLQTGDPGRAQQQLRPGLPECGGCAPAA